MEPDLLNKKIEQMRMRLARLVSLLSRPRDEFLRDEVAASAAERNFQLVVDTASEVNAHLVLARGGPTPDTYAQSFTALGKTGVIAYELAETLAEGAKLCNVLVHEYDIIEDTGKFYDSAIRLLPAFQKYLQCIHAITASE